MNVLLKFVFVMGWIAGIVIAKGFGSTVAAVLLTPYAWYLVIEKIMLINGWM